MSATDGRHLHLTVETPVASVRLIRVAGRLDRTAAASVLRLLGVQLELIREWHRAVTDLVIDVGAVQCFEPGGLDSLRHAPYSAGRRGLGVYLSGCGGRAHLLPLHARKALSEFRTFPSADVAVRVLARSR